MKTNLKTASVLIACLTVFLFSCEKRKDFLKDEETASAKAPQIAIRRMNSINPYAQTFSDTSIIGVQGYKLQCQIIGSFNPASVAISCLTMCDSVVSTVWHADSSYFQIFIKQSSTVGFEIKCSNNYNQTASAHFTLTFKNSKPIVNIRKYGSSNPYAKVLTDTCSYATSPVYNIDYNYSDDNSNYTNLHVVKATTGDPSVVTVTNGKISINYSALTLNKTFVYKIYGKDPLNLTSDTCYATINCTDKAPLVYIRPALSIGNYSTTLSDTCHYPTSPVYNIGFTYTDDNSTYTSLTCKKVTAGDPALITVTNGNIAINYGASFNLNKTYQYKIYGTDPQNLTGDTAYATVVCNNRAPYLYIVNQSGNNVTTFVDSLKTTTSITYNLNVKIFDETATISNMSVMKLTSGDNTILIKTGNVLTLNYSTTGVNKAYQYKLYLTDLQGLVSDTCYFKVYVFKNRPPVFVAGLSQNIGTAVNITSTQAPYYFNLNSYTATGICTVGAGNIPASANATPANLNISAYDPDSYSFGGYIQKIRYIFHSTGWYGTCSGNSCYSLITYHPNQLATFVSAQNSYLLSTYTIGSYPWFDMLPCYGMQHLARYDLVLYDNDGDSTIVPQFSVQF